MTAMLQAVDLAKRFGGLSAVDGVSFTLEPGTITALIGPNGAGKTTLFNMLGGASTPSDGRILFAGDDITGLPPHRRARIGIGRTFQTAAVFRSMTVAENITSALLAVRGHAGDATALLDATGIGAHAASQVSSLSYGDVKRLELAMTLAARPKLLLLDEPTAGMAAAERRRIMETITALADDHDVTMLFTEHDMDAVFGFASRVLVLDQGRLIADGPPDAVRADPLVQSVYLGHTESGDA